MYRLAAIALLPLALAAFSPPASAQEQARRKPNIVLILADDLGYGEPGCYGQKKIRTPALDRLAADGVRFTHHYSGNAVCAPSRCVLMTGLHSGHAQIRSNGELPVEGQRPILPGTRTLARLLKQAGYATACIGKWGLGGPATAGEPGRQGFDHFFGYLCQRHAHNHYPRYLWRNTRQVVLEGNTRGLTGKHFSHDLFTEEALRFISASRERPFFLYLPYAVPHLAIQVPEDSLAEYRGKWEDPPYEGGKGYLPHPAPRAGYAAMVSRMDRDIGRIRAHLEKLGLGRDTIVLFSSDNGPTYGRLGGSDSEFFNSAAGLRGLKGSLYEGGIRVPLLAAWPGKIPAGRTTDHVSAFQDIMPTLLEIAGLPVPADLDGISFAPTLLGKGAQRGHEYLYWEFPSYGGQQAVRLGHWKGVRQNMRRGSLQVELYDLAKDPAESRDVASSYPQVVARIRTVMREARSPSTFFPLPGVDGR